MQKDRQCGSNTVVTINGESNKSFENLKRKLKELKFGENFHWEIEIELQKREPHFQIVAEQEIDNKAFVAVLNFSRKKGVANTLSPLVKQPCKMPKATSAARYFPLQTDTA